MVCFQQNTECPMVMKPSTLTLSHRISIKSKTRNYARIENITNNAFKETLPQNMNELMDHLDTFRQHEKLTC